MESVIGDENDGGIGTGQGDQALEHDVVGIVGGVDDVLVFIEVLVRGPVHLRGGGKA